jgi:hypothetical protein
LFDKGLLRIDRQSCVRLSEPLRSSHYAELDGRILATPLKRTELPDRTALERHRRYVANRDDGAA